RVLLTSIWDGERSAWAADVGALRGVHSGWPLTALPGPCEGDLFRPDGRQLAGASGGLLDMATLQVWDTRTGRRAGRPLAMGITLIAGVRFSPDGRRLLSAEDRSDGPSRLWELATGKGSPLDSVRVPLSGQGFLPEFSPDGRLLLVTTGDRQTVRFRDGV